MRGLRTGRALLFFSLALSLQLFAQAEKTGKPDSSGITELVVRAVANYKGREAQLENYTYLAHVVRTEFDRHGKPKGEITGTDEVMMLEGAPYRRTILLNGQPLSPAQKQEQQKFLDAEAEARRAGYNNRPVHIFFLAPIAQLPEGFRLRRLGQQILDGREVEVIEASPLHGPAPAGTDHEYARHFKMKLWIDPHEAQVVRVESEVIRNVVLDQQFFGVSANLKFSGMQTWRLEYARGTTTAMEWAKVNDEAWLPKWSSWKASRETATALTPEQRAGPLKFPYQGTQTFSDYKKFRVDTRIVPK